MVFAPMDSVNILLVKIKSGSIDFLKDRGIFVGIVATRYLMQVCSMVCVHVVGGGGSREGGYQHLPFSSESSNTWKFVIEDFLICSSNTFQQEFS